ncbi:hypothetical protein B0H13DRAFT_157042 [Mycena leptocephala]|nr:hypothetical protein B0H13DRAFT_157042 [Mycena leptocephala]
MWGRWCSIILWWRELVTAQKRPPFRAWTTLCALNEYDRCSPCWRIHCAEDTRQERGVFPVSPRIAAPHRVVHTRIGAHRRACTTSRENARYGTSLRTTTAPSAATAKCRSSSAATGTLALVRRTTAMTVFVPTTSVQKKVVTKERRARAGLSRCLLRRARPPC